MSKYIDLKVTVFSLHITLDRSCVR